MANPYFTTTEALTHAGVMAMLSAGISTAEAMAQPQVIVIVDVSGEVLGEIRMTGSKFLSRKSALSKARTAASIGAPSDSVPDAVRTSIGLATGGDVTGLPGGLPIRRGGVLLGGIGVGSGSGPQDIEVAQSALAAIGADT
ncbi:heme-binding protein [Roseobacter sp. YSTF-M11]|uniref:Heme-binding protein n=1 Tax=Roseobacter insulae TaxID=2859783 RepID=A0A9X1JYP4_9RHOB|nr:heme-binding protein [Roseobacter insulae]MBW4708375.1 heme-binding protein [Roseobacter insulae]